LRALTARRGALEAIERILNRGGDRDDVLLDVVAVLGKLYDRVAAQGGRSLFSDIVRSKRRQERHENGEKGHRCKLGPVHIHNADDMVCRQKAQRNLCCGLCRTFTGIGQKVLQRFIHGTPHMFQGLE
jgi:hypothetical protein